jgi:carbonic anhydrase
MHCAAQLYRVLYELPMTALRRSTRHQYRLRWHRRHGGTALLLVIISATASFTTCAEPNQRIPPAVRRRNVGNLIPVGRQDASVDAAIAFAVEKLGVSTIVVCGHSSCGAMAALLSQSTDGSVPSGGDAYLSPWLIHGQSALTAFRGGIHPIAQSAAAEGFGAVDQLSMVNVAVQVETLTIHPLVAGAHREGRLNVIGLFYDIATAQALQVDPTGVSAFDGQAVLYDAPPQQNMRRH